MLHFGETLGDLMRKHGFRATELCEELKMSKSHFSKIKNGRLLPGNYSMIEQLAEIMRLSGSEKEQLSDAYKNAKFGHAYSTIEAAVEKLYGIREPLPEPSDLPLSVPMPASGRQIIGKEHILPVIQRMLTHGAGSIHLLWSPEDEETCEAIQRAMAALGEGVTLEWLVYLSNESGVSAENVRVFADLVPLALTGRAEIRYCYVDLVDYFSLAVFPYLLLTASGVLLLSRDGTEALYLEQAETVERYLQHFHRQFYGARCLARVFDDFSTFLMEYDTLLTVGAAPSDFYIIERRPCITHEADLGEIRPHLADTENGDRLAEQYIAFIRKTMQNLRTQYTYFSQPGMREYFEAEEYYEAAPHITRSVSKHLRRKYFQRLVDRSKRSDRLVPGILLTSLFEHTHIHVINIWSSGAMLLMFNFHAQFRILAVQEKSIAMSLIAYFQSLQDCGIILSKSGSIAEMERKLAQYTTDTA